MTQDFPGFPGANQPESFPGVPTGQQGLPAFPEPAPAQPAVDTGSVSDFLSGGNKVISFGSETTGGFKRLNKPFGGVLISARTAPVTKYDQVTQRSTGEVERWDNGAVKTQLILTLDTQSGPYPERDDELDNGHRDLYIKGSMVKVFRQAVMQGNSGRVELNPGGLLIGMHTGRQGLAYTWKFAWNPTGGIPGVPTNHGEMIQQVTKPAPAPQQQQSGFNPFA